MDDRNVGDPTDRQNSNYQLQLIKQTCAIFASIKLTLARLALSPPSLRRFASRGLLSVWLRWDVASLVLLVWRFEDLIDWLLVDCFCFDSG